MIKEKKKKEFITSSYHTIRLLKIIYFREIFKEIHFSCLIETKNCLNILTFRLKFSFDYLTSIILKVTNSFFYHSLHIKNCV